LRAILDAKGLRQNKRIGGLGIGLHGVLA
jgi:hypothetical protein